MTLDNPLVIYSRMDLNRCCWSERSARGPRSRRRVLWGSSGAVRAGACKTKHGAADADFLVVATGARNPLRTVGTEYKAEDTMSALGYYVPAQQDRIDIQFLENLEGYIWVFPRAGHLSVGICGKAERRMRCVLASNATCRSAASP